jgi:hypothetical protein
MVKKQLAECLVLSKLDYNDAVFNPLYKRICSKDYNASN